MHKKERESIVKDVTRFISFLFFFILHLPQIGGSLHFCHICPFCHIKKAAIHTFEEWLAADEWSFLIARTTSQIFIFEEATLGIFSQPLAFQLQRG